MLHLPCDLFDVWVGRWFGREGRRSALFIWMLVVWVVIWSCSVKQVVVPRIAPKAVISLLEASKRSGGLLRALTCYLFYLHLRNSDPQLIQYDLIDCALVSLLYILYGSMWISMFSIFMARWYYVGEMEWGLFSIKRDAYGDIYGLHFSLYGNCIAYHSLHWHMELCREPMVPTVPVQHRLLGITMQLHILLGMKAGDIALPCIVAFAFALWLWDVRCMPWSMALGYIAKKWYLIKN